MNKVLTNTKEGMGADFRLKIFKIVILRTNFLENILIALKLIDSGKRRIQQFLSMDINIFYPICSFLKFVS